MKMLEDINVKSVRKRKIEAFLILTLYFSINFLLEGYLGSYTVYEKPKENNLFYEKKGGDASSFPRYPFDGGAVLNEILKGEFPSNEKKEELRRSIGDFVFYLELEELNEKKKKEILISKLDKLISEKLSETKDENN